MVWKRTAALSALIAAVISTAPSGKAYTSAGPIDADRASRVYDFLKAIAPHYLGVFIAVLSAALLVITVLAVNIAKKGRVIAKQSLELQSALDNMTSVLDKSDAMIYVTDVETDEILYISECMKRHFGIEGDVTGRHCYKMFNVGVESRCVWCPCHQLDKEPDKAHIWEERNTLTGRYYRNIDRYVDWPGGKKVHIQYSYDLTDIKQAQRALEYRGTMLDTLNRTAIMFLSPNKETFEEMMSAGIRQIVDLFDIDRFSLFRNFKAPDGLHTSQIFKWDRIDGGTTEPNAFYADITYAEFAPNWEHILKGGNVINGPSKFMLGREAASLAAAGIISAFVVPLFFERALWGFAIYEDRRNERYFDDDSADIMRASAFLCVNAVIRDEMEREIGKANERTQILLDKTPLCCQLWDSSFNKIDCNEAAVKLFGFKGKRDFLERYFELYPEYQSDGTRSDEKIVACLKKAFEHGDCFFNWTYRMLDGTVMPAEITLVRVNIEDGYGVAGYTRDLREHIKMMKDIEYKDNLLLAVNHAGAFLLNADIDSFENALYKSMQVLAEAVSIDRVRIWKNHTTDGKLHCTQLHEWSEGAEPQRGKEGTITVAYGERLPGWEETLSKGECINNFVSKLSEREQKQLSAQGVRSVLVLPVILNDCFWGLVGFDDCHRERVFNEEEVSLLRSGSMLFTSALFRNEMVLNIRNTSAQLESALEQAEAASKAKGDFLSSMSHEMRTPMNAIIGMTAIGKKADGVDGKNYALDKIGDASSHLLGVINDVLDMAKIEANKLELTPVEFNFERMLQRVSTVIIFRVQEKRQQFSMNIDGNIPSLLIGDDQRLAQVIANLISNAVKFTPEGGIIRLDAFLLSETDGDCELRVEVTDNGIGIAPEQHERLFGMFEQAESGTSRKYGGTGLGLVISKNIIELMGGRIWMESELGKGAKFIFIIKARRGGSNDNYSHPAADGAVETDGEFTGKRMLLAEDIEINREILIALLGDTGLIIECAENGKEALDMIAANKYDIVFMDVQMPIMDGLESARRIRSDARNAGLPIIAMTANVFKDDVEACLAAGMDDHLGKPLDIEKVIEKLREYLKGRC